MASCILVMAYAKSNQKFRHRRQSLRHPPGTDEERMMPTKQALVSVGRIDQLIYAVRGQRVMLDRDLAKLYGIRLKESDEEKIRARFQKAKDKLLPLETSLAFTDGLIDEIVYRLYGLTPDEIKLVEKTSRP